MANKPDRQQITTQGSRGFKVIKDGQVVQYVYLAILVATAGENIKYIAYFVPRQEELTAGAEQRPRRGSERNFAINEGQKVEMQQRLKTILGLGDEEVPDNVINHLAFKRVEGQNQLAWVN